MTNLPTPLELAEKLRAHVNDRGGLSRDAETGEIVLPNGAWAMMLAAADVIEELYSEIKGGCNDQA